MTRYFWYIQKFCNWPCFVFCETRNYKTVRLLQVLHTFTLKLTFLTSNLSFAIFFCFSFAKFWKFDYDTIFLIHSKILKLAVFKFWKTTKDGILCLSQGLTLCSFKLELLVVNLNLMFPFMKFTRCHRLRINFISTLTSIPSFLLFFCCFCRWWISFQVRGQQDTERKSENVWLQKIALIYFHFDSPAMLY